MKLVQKSGIYTRRTSGSAGEFFETETSHSTRIERRGGERHPGGSRIHGKPLAVPLRQNCGPVWFQNQQNERRVGAQIIMSQGQEALGAGGFAGQFAEQEAPTPSPRR
jgi:hypothetical protein